MRPTLRDGGPAIRLARFHAYRNAALSPNNITVTNIPLDLVRAGGDPLGMLTPDGAMLVPYTGIWDIAAAVGWTQPGTTVGVRGVWIINNGATMNQGEVQAASSTGDNTIVSLPFSNVLLSRGDKVTLAGYQASGAALPILVGAYTFLAAKLVSPL